MLLALGAFSASPSFGAQWIHEVADPWLGLLPGTPKEAADLTVLIGTYAEKDLSMPYPS